MRRLQIFYCESKILERKLQDPKTKARRLVSKNCKKESQSCKEKEKIELKYCFYFKLPFGSHLTFIALRFSFFYSTSFTHTQFLLSILVALVVWLFQLSLKQSSSESVAHQSSSICLALILSSLCLLLALFQLAGISCL